MSKITGMNKVIEEITKRVVPSLAQRAQREKAISLFLQSLNKVVVNGEAILGGSGAKDTWLAAAADIDIFVLYDYGKYAARSMELSEMLESALQSGFPNIKRERLHGSRDYFRMEYEGLWFEVVPILKISSAREAKNITDISPLHARWINKSGKRLKDEIRLAKQFCKSQQLYGAESYINGFSGYVLEILVIYYGSFEKLLRAAVKWKEKEVVDAAGYYKSKNVLFELNKSKLVSPLIVIDPVDKTRNAAAALSLEKWKLFTQRAKEYLAKPSVRFFERARILVEKLQQEKRGKEIVYLELESLEGKEDVVGVKLLRVFEFLREGLGEFGVVESGWEWEGRVVMYFVVSLKELDKKMVRGGPTVQMTEFAQKFRAKYKDKAIFVKEGRLYASVEREYTGLKEVVKVLLRDVYVRERVKKVDLVKVC